MEEEEEISAVTMILYDLKTCKDSKFRGWGGPKYSSTLS
jgi:hypothetical protein